MSEGQVHKISSSDELESVIKKDQFSVIWIFDSDSANRRFGQKYEDWVAIELKGAVFYKAGSDDVTEAVKSHRLTVDNIAVFKGGELVKEEREEHNAVYKAVKDLL